MCLSSGDSAAEGSSLTFVLIVPKDVHKALFIQQQSKDRVARFP